MLIITRKVGESIVIGDGIVLTVVQLQRGRARLGIEAPPEVGILRGELQPLGVTSQAPREQPAPTR